MTAPSDNTYEPRGGAKALLKCQARSILLEGPRNTGKTRAVLEKLFIIASHCKNARILILRATRASLTESVLVEWEKTVVPAGHPCLAGPSRDSRRSYKFPNGAIVVVGGLDTPERYRSAQFDIVYISEANEVDVEDLETMEGSARNQKISGMPYNQVICDCNPKQPSHWLNRRCEMKREDGSPLLLRILTRHEDNPNCTEDQLSVLRNLTGVRRARDYEGKWAAAEGAIYDFQRERHVKRVDTDNWPRTICGCDDGNRNPFAFLRGRVDFDGNLHIEAEHHASGMVPETKVQVARRMGAGSESIQIDPAAGIKLAFKDAGLPVQDGDNKVLEGIARVAHRFASNTITIDPGCVKLIDEIEAYEWMDNEKKDQPIKDRDHGNDALRYLIARLDRTGGAMIVNAYEPKVPVSIVDASKTLQPVPEMDKLRANAPDWGWEDV